MIIKIIFFVLSSYIYCQTNPVGIATAGAHKLRMKGQINIFHNPATLGCYASQMKIKNHNKKVLKKSKDLNEAAELVPPVLPVVKEETNKKKPDTDSLVMKDLESEVFVEKSLDSISINSNGAIIALNDSGYTKSNFSMSLFNISFRLGSGSITPDWINNQ